jgi:pyrroloquinoline quinone (PQQ) biosynthesis protein C
MQGTAFKNVIRSARVAEPLPVDQWFSMVDAFIDAHNPYRINRIVPAIGNGTAPLSIVKRYALELYYLGMWMTPEFANLIANAPDAYSLTLEHSEHYFHWCQNFADETGYLRDPNHVLMKVEYCHQLGISDDEILAYEPMPETVGSVFTLLYYLRRSYEEGLAALGYARERIAGLSGYAGTLYQGMKQHYGVEVQNLKVHAYAEEEHGDKAKELLEKVVLTHSMQQRCRRAIEHTILTNEMRTHALNRWLDERQ